MSVPQKVLVIDNDLFFAVKAEATIKKMGYEAIMADTREKAIEIAKENALCLILLSYGKEFLRPLELTRELKMIAPTPILGYIAHGKIPEMRPLSKEAGCDLLIANSAFAMRLPQMIQKLAPIGGDVPDFSAALQIGMEGE